MAALTFASGEPPILPEPIAPPKPVNLPTETLEKPVPLSSKSTPSLGVQIAHLKGSEEGCIRKSFTTLANQTGIRFLELKPGNVLSGYTDIYKLAVLITAVQQDECVVVVLATSWKNDRPGDLAKKIGDQLERAPQETKSVKRVGTRDLELEQKLPALLWRLETCKPNHLTSNLRHFGNAAALFMEKYGYERVMPFPPDDGATSVCTMGTKREMAKTVAAILMEVGGKGESVYFLVFGASPNEEALGKEVNNLLTDLLKWFYE